MLKPSILVSGDERIGAACGYCHASMRLDEAIVTCPRCKAIYHVDCWEENNNRCAALGCSGRGKASNLPQPDPTPELAPPPTDLLDEIEIEPIEFTTNIPTEVLDAIEIFTPEEDFLNETSSEDIEIDDLPGLINWSDHLVSNSESPPANPETSIDVDMITGTAKITFIDKLKQAWARFKAFLSSPQ